MDGSDDIFGQIAASLGQDPKRRGQIVDEGGCLPSHFAVSQLANMTMMAAANEIAAFCGQDVGAVEIDQRLAGLWFGMSIDPIGWNLPPLWDDLAGDYPCANGWVRLHTNAPHHRAAVLAALSPFLGQDMVQDEGGRPAVAAAILSLNGEEIESAILAEKGCAAFMYSPSQWAASAQGKAVAHAPLIDWDVAPQKAVAAPAVLSAPLAGVKVLDLTRVLAGPVATRFLAAYGANILRIDPPNWDEPGVVPEVSVGKICAGLDLTQANDRATFEQLVIQADILVHGYRPHALAGLGFDKEDLRRLNPHLVDITLCAYGWDGPMAHRRGFDSLVQMSSGIAQYGMAQEDAERPRPLPVQALDHGTGYLMAAAAIAGFRHSRAGHGPISARLSLAGLAHLLLSAPKPALPLAAQTPIGPPRDDDYVTAIEPTFWGPARRLKWPITIGGNRPSFTLPAGPLRASPVGWL